MVNYQATGLGQVIDELVTIWNREEELLLEWHNRPRLSVDTKRLQTLDETIQSTESSWLSLLPRLDGTNLSLDETATSVLNNWLRSDNEALSQQGALLLAEAKHITLQSLPPLLASLQASEDLTRYRARQAIQNACRQPASRLGRAVIEQLASEYPKNTGALVGTHLGWALGEIIHDRPEWLRDWVDSGLDEIYGRVHKLGSESWDEFQSLLRQSAPSAQKTLLESFAWLLRIHGSTTGLSQVPVTSASLLFNMVSHEELPVRRKALVALGFWPAPTTDVLRQLLDLHEQSGNTWHKELSSAFYETVARLATRADDEGLVAAATTLLRSKIEEPAGEAAWVRLYVGREKTRLYSSGDFSDREIRQIEKILPELETEIPHPPTLVSALLQAGTDDEHWSHYHKKIILLIRALIRQNDSLLLRQLLKALQSSLQADDWPPRRIAFGAVATCAEAMSDVLNTVWPREELEELLIASTEDAESFTARHSAITALANLHLATPSVIEVLLRATQDIGTVQQHAVAAAARFRRLSPDFIAENAFDPLEATLRGESLAAAYTAAQLLAVLGSSPAAIEIPGLRQRIATMLSEAMQHPRVEDLVYLMEEHNIVARGTLAEVLLNALLQVRGLPG